jgi:hypothetical protein
MEPVAKTNAIKSRLRFATSDSTPGQTLVTSFSFSLSGNVKTIANYEVTCRSPAKIKCDKNILTLEKAFFGRLVIPEFSAGAIIQPRWIAGQPGFSEDRELCALACTRDSHSCIIRSTITVAIRRTSRSYDCHRKLCNRLCSAASRLEESPLSARSRQRGKGGITLGEALIDGVKFGAVATGQLTLITKYLQDLSTPLKPRARFAPVGEAFACRRFGIGSERNVTMANIRADNGQPEVNYLVGW